MASDIRLRNLYISGFPSHGVHIEGYNVTTAKVARVALVDCAVESCVGAGVFLKNAFDVHLVGCQFKSSLQHGVNAIGGSATLQHCGFDGNTGSASWNPTTNTNDGNLKLDGCEMGRVDACRFINVNVGNVRKALVVVGGVAVISNCYIEAANAVLAQEGLVVVGAGGGPVAILSNRFRNIQTMIRVASGVRDCVVFPQFEDSNVGAIVLPDPNDGLLAVPHVVRAATSDLSGLQLPSYAQNPPNPAAGTWAGMLAYRASASPALVLWDGTNWRDVVVIQEP